MDIALVLFHGYSAADVHSGVGVSLLPIKEITENCISTELIQLGIAYATTKMPQFYKFHNIAISSYILSAVIISWGRVGILRFQGNCCGNKGHACYKLLGRGN